MKMNQELKERWATALESGKYTQCYGGLETVENGVTKNCCLGVLARECGAIPGGEVWKDSDGGSWIKLELGEFLYTSNFNGPNDELLTYDPETLQTIADDYIGYNDEGLTFAEIAAKIRQDERF